MPPLPTRQTPPLETADLDPPNEWTDYATPADPENASGSAVGVQTPPDQRSEASEDASPDTRDGTLISFGLSLEDRLAKRVTIQVFLFAVFIAAFSIIHFITNMMMGTYEASAANPTGGASYNTDRLWSNLAGLIIELSIPAAGYLGALYHNRQLTCCFCSCNLFLVFASSWSFASLTFRQRELSGNCYLETEDQQRSLCWMWLDDGAHKWVFIGDVICSVTLSCCAAMASIRLFHKLSREPPNIEANPVVGEVVRLQENTPLTRVNQRISIAPNGQEVALYSIDRASMRASANVPAPPGARMSVPRASQVSLMPRQPSVRIELRPDELQEDDF